MAALVDLCPKSELVNANFDHYQLSLDSVPSYDTCLNKNIDVAKPSETSFSSHHAKLFGIHNHLFSDPWSDSAVYFCDKEWNIGMISIAKLSKPEVRDTLFQVPDVSNLRLKPDRFNLRVAFPSASLALIVNGVDYFYLLDTEERRTQKKWKVLFGGSLPSSGQSHQLVDTMQWTEGENHRVEFLVASVEEVKDRQSSPYITVLSWLTLLSVDGKSWSVERTRRLDGSRPFDYACIDAKGDSIHIVSQKMFTMTEDTVKPVEHLDSWEMVGNEEPAPMYTWSQTVGEVTIHLTIPDGVTKANLSVAISGDRLEVSVKNSVDMLKGNLHARVDTDGSTWTVDGRRLEITLQKVEEEMWPIVIVGDLRGELVLTAEEVEVIHERLAHLTSEHWNADPDKDNKPFNSQMLEECDAVDEEGLLIIRVDGETHRITHKIISNNQFLFSVRLETGHIPAICLRHDVDGFVWKASQGIQPDKCPWEHVGVLNAFGYVMASKQQRRFTSCSPDMSVAVIADSQRHVYLYRQKVSVMTPLRNRKTGQNISSVAKQQVLSLDCNPDVIVGMHITNTRIFLATEQRVLVYVLKPDE